MNRTRMCVTVLAVVLVAFVFASSASAQTNASILDGQWFKLKGSMTGYTLGDDDETVLGKGGGPAPITYLLFSYDGSTGYTLTTCVQDDFIPDSWHKTDSAPLSTDNIYGATYPQIWEFGGIPIVLFDGYSTVSLYTTLYITITAEGAFLNKAKIKSLTCGVSADIEGNYAVGSCKLTGSLIPAAKVLTTVPALCRQ